MPRELSQRREAPGCAALPEGIPSFQQAHSNFPRQLLLFLFSGQGAGGPPHPWTRVQARPIGAWQIPWTLPDGQGEKLSFTWELEDRPEAGSAGGH